MACLLRGGATWYVVQCFHLSVSCVCCNLSCCSVKKAGEQRKICSVALVGITEFVFKDITNIILQLVNKVSACICVVELKEEVVYYDVCEDPEELQSMVHTGIQQADSAAVSQLKRRLQALETKRGSICARRAYLRNKKVWASSISVRIGVCFRANIWKC